MSSACLGGSLGAEQMRNKVLHRHQAIEHELSADDEEGDSEAVLVCEFDESSHGRGHVVASGRVSLEMQTD